MLKAETLKSVAACVVIGWLLGVRPVWAQANVITNVADVRALSLAEAAKARPVKLRGVVIDRSDPWEQALIVADATGGIYALARTTLFAPNRRGDLLELTGVTDPGEFAPIVKVSAVEKLGTAPMPEPRPATFHQLITGVMDAQWVEIAGIVQQHGPEAGNSNILRTVVSVDGKPVHIRSVGQQDPNLTEDAAVRVHALCFYQVNQKRQLLSPILSVPRGISIIVEKSAPADPFAAPIHLAESLLQFSPEVSSGHRVHLRGVVTHRQDEVSAWIRDGTSGLRLQTRSREAVQPGDVIDVLGFPKYGAGAPTLEECIFRKLGQTNPPTPLHLTSITNAFNHEDDLISLDATLADAVPLLEGVTLTLTTPELVFKAVLKSSQTTGRPNWQPGSRVRVAGICSVIYGDSRPVMGVWHPQSFQLLLRAPDDLTILQAPSWWNVKHVAYVLGAALVVLLLATAMISLLARRRLLEQERHRAMAEAEFAAILSERNRMAREIHDTLAQGLTATSFQLRLAKKHVSGTEAELNQHLDSAQELVRGSLAEARNSIWNMRSQVLETQDLPGALENILKQMADGSDCKTSLTVTGHARRLAPVTENNLLRVGQEAITNAVRHANAGQVRVQLDFDEKQLRLSVMDDGCGFDSTRPPQSNGGFGLVGMRERAKEMNGEVQIRSAPGQGTEITLSIPLSG